MKFSIQKLQKHHCSFPRYIVATEGVRGLFKGLGPNLVGVAPSRAIYFYTYSTVKRTVNATVPKSNRDTPFVHVISAMSAGKKVTNKSELISFRTDHVGLRKRQEYNISFPQSTDYKEKLIPSNLSPSLFSAVFCPRDNGCKEFQRRRDFTVNSILFLLDYLFQI